MKYLMRTMTKYLIVLREMDGGKTIFKKVKYFTLNVCGVPNEVLITTCETEIVA